jgi:hypothetical protein
MVVRYKVLGFEESGVKILLYLMRLGNAIVGGILSVDDTVVEKLYSGQRMPN